jgi:peptidoglycan/xylan/chitin deacetylase (PgdA/CDA1 family)
MDIRGMAYQLRSMLLRDHYWCFEKIMEVEETAGVRSTFFFLNETYPVSVLRPSSWRLGAGYYDVSHDRVKEVIRRLDMQVWEIGLHGSYLSYKDRDLLEREKSELESIVGHAVVGVRQHYLNLDENTWEMQADAGFLYDSSYGYRSEIGFKEGRYFSFKPMPGRRFRVVPLALMDSCVMNRKNPLAEAMNIVEIAEEKRACLVLNWHQRVFNKREFAGYLEIYLKLIEECKRKKAAFYTIRDYTATLPDEGFIR